MHSIPRKGTKMTETMADELEPEEVAGWRDSFDHETDGLDEPPKTRWRIETDSAAIWAGRKAVVAAAEMARVQEAYEREIERLDEWRRAKQAGPMQQANWFAAAVIDWHLREIDRLEAEGVKARANVEYGGLKVSSSLRSPAIEVDDADRAALWLLSSEDESVRAVVNMVPKVPVSELRKRLVLVRRAASEDGEIVEQEPGSKKKFPPRGFEEIAPEIRLDGEPVPAPDQTGIGVAPGHRTIKAKADGFELGGSQ